MLLCRNAFLASWFKLCFQELPPAVSLLAMCIWAITIESFLALTKRMSRFLMLCAIFSTACVFSSKMFAHVFIYLVIILILLEMKDISSFSCSWREPFLLKTPVSLWCTWYLLSNSWHSCWLVLMSPRATFWEVTSSWRWRPGLAHEVHLAHPGILGYRDITCQTKLPLSAREAVGSVYRFDKTHTVSKGWFVFILMSCLGPERLDLSIHSVKLYLTSG